MVVCDTPINSGRSWQIHVPVGKMKRGRGGGGEGGTRLSGHSQFFDEFVNAYSKSNIGTFKMSNHTLTQFQLFSTLKKKPRRNIEADITVRTVNN